MNFPEDDRNAGLLALGIVLGIGILVWKTFFN
jgi:hypothetical protein